MFATLVPKSSITFVSQASLERGVAARYGLKKRVESVKNTRKIGKKDMKFNDAQPEMRVDPETYEVSADGVRCHCDPAEELPLTQLHFLF